MKETVEKYHLNPENADYLNKLASHKNPHDLMRLMMKEMFGNTDLPVSQFQKTYWMIRGFSEEEAKKKVSELQDHTSRKRVREKLMKAGKTEQEVMMILEERSRKNSERSKRVHNDQREKDPLYVNKMSRFFKEFWMKKGFSESESVLLAAKASSDNRKKFREKLDSGEVERGWNTTTLDYWTKQGYSVEEAIRKRSERQCTFSLEKCIEKYGEVEGKIVWKNRQEKWKKSVFNTVRWIGGGISTISLDLFKRITENDRAQKGKNEKFIYYEGFVFKYDFCLNKKIIEFNGDYWHCNPNKYSSDYFHKNKQMLARDIWEFDRKKEEAARSKGYDYLVVWESEYKLFPEEIINKCKKFLNES